MNRQQLLTEALAAARSSKEFAKRVENAAYNGDSMREIPRYAAAATGWADTARAFAAIAAALPEKEA